MPILLKMNLKCNFNCKYCYQKPIRPEEEIIDHEKVVDRIYKMYNEDKENPNIKKPTITLHGGEPTILPIVDFKRYLKLIYDLTERSTIQTNAYDITDEMILLFKKYKTHVGISVDGPYPLNQLRGLGTDEQRKKCTEQVMYNMERMYKEDISLSVISVINKVNAAPENRKAFKKWIDKLEKMKISGRLNLCCTGNPEYDLTIKEAIEFYSDMYDYFLEKGYSGWSPIKDIINSYSGKKEVVCVFRTCDPYSTSSARTILNDGSLGVCLRLHQDGKRYIRCETTEKTRNMVLFETDCKDCKWWKHCFGGCSGLSIDDDWRNKDRFCEVYKFLFQKTENTFKSLKIPAAKD